MKVHIALGAFAALCLAAGLSAAAPQKIPAYVTAAVSNPDRPEADTKTDADRKPADCVAFAGIKPGDKVADLIPGRGYYTRIFSGVVGPKGWVYAFVPSELIPLLQKNNIPFPPPANPKFANVSFLQAPVAKFVAPEKLDVVWTSQNYHDLHNKNFGQPDMNAFNKAVFDALKPGGTYIVLDHAAAAGSGAGDTETLHRIDPALVKKEVLAAGFVFAGESKVMADPTDDHTKKIFDPSIRGKTDRFLFKFRKPRK
jgi:predicted methyltransferase